MRGRQLLEASSPGASGEDVTHSEYQQCTGDSTDRIQRIWTERKITIPGPNEVRVVGCLRDWSIVLAVNRPKGGEMRPRILPTLVYASALMVPSLFSAIPASAASCIYDAPSRVVSISTQGGQTVLEAIGGNIVVNTLVCSPATVTNTDRINVLGSSASESVAISLATGVFSPGATDEGDGTSEIEFTVDLFGQFEDALIVVGSFGNDTLTTGTAGINLNDDFDLDVTAGGLSYLQVFGLGGNDTISAAGGRGTGDPDSVTNLYGDSGWDLLTG